MIELHPEEKMPLYEQLYNALAQDIRSGTLQPGKALPGRRTMAAQLGISTNTVDTAYQMLAAEGLAVTRPRSGAKAWDDMLDFAGKCRDYVPNVVMTIEDKDKTEEDIARCRAITEKLGVTLRIRAYIPD